MRKISDEKIKQITDLRRRGNSIPEISKLLQLPKSTVLRYIQGVEVLPEYKQRLADRRNASKIISDRAKFVAQQVADKLFEQIDKRDKALIAACLYWAEGDKKNFGFTNTDPKMVKVFIKSLQDVFLVKNSEIKVSIRVYEDLNIEKCIHFWSDVVGFNLTGDVSINILKGKKKGKLEYGMCRIRVVKPSLLHKTIFAITKRVEELITPRSSMDRASHS